MMAWFSKLFIFIILSVLLTQCQSSAGEVTDAFKTVDGSLNKSTGDDRLNVDGLYAYLHQNAQKYGPLVSRAEKVYAATTDVHAFIEDLKQTLKSKDSSGVSTTVPAALLLSNETSDQLTKKFSTLYDLSHAALMDRKKERSLDSALNAFHEIRTDKQWTSKYFDQTPTIAAITILTKFQYDCLDAARIVLSDIKQHPDN